VSADNWAECPRCKVRAAAEIDRQLAAVQARYGEVSADEYLELMAAVPKLPERADSTFREDYEIYGAASGVVKVSYGGHCMVCDLDLQFTHEHRIEGIND
jgi:hypothetical protein